ncbi:MAG: glycosyltransferase family 2 protein [Candidatus Woesearchaeota archaeon]
MSVYRTNLLQDLGGFDEHNITEDFEIAMRLKFHGYNIQLETKSITYTNVPDTFRALKRQRVRWFRGYIFNHIKYKSMFFDRNNKFMGYFQLPLNIISIGILLLSTTLIGYGTFTTVRELIQRALLIKGYIPSLFYIPPLKEIILGHDIQIMFPIYIGAIGGFYLFYVAHKETNEKFKHPLSIWLYFTIFPLLNFYYWVCSLVQEVFRSKRKW